MDDVKYLTVGELKRLLEGVDDSTVVSIVDVFGVSKVSSVGFLQSSYEECDSVGFSTGTSSMDRVDAKTSACKHVMFDGFRL